MLQINVIGCVSDSETCLCLCVYTLHGVKQNSRRWKTLCCSTARE